MNMLKYIFLIMWLLLMSISGFHLEAQSEANSFLKGGDISMLPKFEKLGVVYRNRDDKPNDAIRIMIDHGCNLFRIRLFVNPTRKDAVIQDLNYILKLAQRIKKAGGLLLLDIHYSDTWADPGHQSKPKAWEKLSFEELVAKVESYTAEVIAKMKKADCLPEMVQVGNEINPGFLWPEGKIKGKEGGWKNFTTLLKTGIRGVKKPLDVKDKIKIMIHIAQGGNANKTKWFFENIEKHNVDYDIIGQSFYPYWHGGIDDLKRNLKQTAETFGKEIIVVETAYPWKKGNETENMNWPQTPEGQKQYLEDVIKAVKATPKGLGKGVLWWYPESIPVKKLHVWKGGRNALFDPKGKVLPAMEAFREK